MLGEQHLNYSAIRVKLAMSFLRKVNQKKVVGQNYFESRRILRISETLDNNNLWMWKISDSADLRWFTAAFSPTLGNNFPHDWSIFSQSWNNHYIFTEARSYVRRTKVFDKLVLGFRFMWLKFQNTKTLLNSSIV